MIQRTFSLSTPYRVLIYARMSSEQQNQRSPEQQEETIRQVMKRCSCPWTIAKTYIDRNIKGRYVKRRPQLQEMLRDIATGVVKIDLIIVDTLERFGRSEEIQTIRQKLLTDHGVMIVAADNNFADPTGIVGKAVGMMEQMRSTEDGRIKAHQVLRGKKDALRQKRWPGGPPPFGYELHKQIIEVGNRTTIVGTLIPHPETASIIVRLFEKAHTTGWGGSRLAKCFNADLSIPDKYKPFYAPTIDHWLDSQIYIGIGIWGRVCTDIVNDARVIEPNPHPEEIVRVEDFCPPLIERELFDAVQAVRQARKRPKRQPEEGAKHIRPISGGLSVKHPLAGLVHCGVCNACCVPRTSGRKSKAGQVYGYYTCPRHHDGACSNGQHLRIDLLNTAVFVTLRRWLFPVEVGQIPDWFAPMVERIERTVKQLCANEPRRTDDLRSQLQQIELRMTGWRQSLGNPQLPPELRQDLEREYQQACSERAGLEAALAAEQALRRQTDVVVDPKRVAAAIGQLDKVLAFSNACLLNVELARHIERIDSYPDGRVKLRGTWLGLFEGAVELLSKPTSASLPAANMDVDGAGAAAQTCPSVLDGSAGTTSPPHRSTLSPLPPSNKTQPARELPKVRSRLLARRALDRMSDQSSSAGAADGALDPHRFEGLEGLFMWDETFTLLPPPYWAAAHAAAVAAKQAQDPKRWNQAALARHFEVSVPTIRKALRLAAVDSGTGASPTPDWSKLVNLSAETLPATAGLTVIAPELTTPSVDCPAASSTTTDLPQADGGGSKAA